MRFYYLLVFGALTLWLDGCNSPSTENAKASSVTASSLLTPGPWRGELQAQGQEIPFLFEIKTEAGKPVLYLVNKGLNGEERLRCNEISAVGDSVTVRMHVFDAALVLRADGPKKLKGTWVRYDAKEPYRVPLTAVDYATWYDNEPSLREPGMFDSFEPTRNFNGTWRITFQDEKGTTYPAVGVFRQSKNAVTGTFLTSTGDYRYLTGRVSQHNLWLSTFDGSHAFLFTGSNSRDTTPDNRANDTVSTIDGHFYSGKSGHETWTAIRDDNAKLPDADTLTYLKKDESRLNFKFPSIFAGGSISSTDAKYRGKVVVIQLLGSWCPNCLDESNFLAPWYEKNKQRGVEVIGLGYERSQDYDKAAARLRNLRTRLNIGYDLAVAGVANKDSVAKSLPQLAKFLAFPTTIFLDKKGKVRKIHTGYSGPGTGKYHQQETAAFEREIDKLLRE